MSELFRVSTIIAAAGKSTRMNAGINKQYMMAAGKPVLAHTIDVFERIGIISEIIIVIGKEDEPVFNDYILNRYKYSKISAVTYGGATGRLPYITVAGGVSQIGYRLRA